MSVETLDVIFKRYHKLPSWSDAGVPFIIAWCRPVPPKAKEAEPETPQLPDDDFSIPEPVEFDTPSSEIVVKGEMYDPRDGEKYRLIGEWQDEPKYGGRSFRFAAFEVIVNKSKDGVVDYLQRYIFGLGIHLARLLVNRFGTETLDVLRKEPDRAKEIDGIGEKTVESIRRHFAETLAIDPVAYAALHDLLNDAGIPRKVFISILQDFGSSAIDVIKQNPYLLLDYPGVGWKTVDHLAMTRMGYERKGIERYKGAIVESLEKIASEGDTYAAKIDLDIAVSELCCSKPSPEAIQALVDEGILVVDSLSSGKPAFALKYLYDAEHEIASRLRRISDAALDFPVAVETEGLQGEQVDAAGVLEENGVALLVGPPGTGKSYSSTRILSSLTTLPNFVTSIGTPTGKAAKRAKELLDAALPDNDIDCTTIHRMLHPTKNRGEIGVPSGKAKFGRGRPAFVFQACEEFPLEINLANIDECSMCDVSLMASFLRAIPDGTRLIFTGDHNQLPSVGPGAVLRDMMMGGIPTAMLTKPRRNSGLIVEACHAIKDGRTPKPITDPALIDLDAGRNWLHIEREEPADIVEMILELHRQTVQDPMWDLQVISPQNGKLDIACDNLNERLSKLLNPGKAESGKSGPRGERGKGSDRYRDGDKIVRKKNGMAEILSPVIAAKKGAYYETDWSWDGRDYVCLEGDETYLVNGDIGQVVTLAEMGRHRYVVVAFRNPDRLVRLPIGDAHIQQAYAVTCHVGQGSGFPYVILPVHSSFHWNRRNDTGLWSRELIYTEFSRAERLLVTVGSFKAIELAISRKTAHKRSTRLAEFIKAAFAAKPAVVVHETEVA